MNWYSSYKKEWKEVIRKLYCCERSTGKLKKYYEKERNRFMTLRYESDTAPYPDITAEALSKEFGVSKGTISFLERIDLTNEEVLANAKETKANQVKVPKVVG